MPSIRTFRRRGRRNSSESGYILITLMMMASIIVIMLAIVLPQMSQQIKRDREMELIHRGVQYSRAIRRFYKKNGRYPVRLEELENSNNIRYLRRRYKDPTNDKDFKLLHFGEVQMGTAVGIAGGVAPGANAFGSVPAPAGNNAFGQSSFGQNTFAGPGRANTAAAVNPNGALSQQTDPMGAATTGNAPQTSTGTTGTTNSSSSTTNSASSSSTSGDSGQNSQGGSSQPGFGNQVFGGGPIVGVVSISKKQSIREFNKKNHYNDWQFIYDPSSDRGGLLNTPAQPPLQGTAPQQQNQQPAGVPVLSPGGQQGGFGQTGPGANQPQTMTPQMPPEQQQAPQ